MDADELEAVVTDHRKPASTTPTSRSWTSPRRSPRTRRPVTQEDIDAAAPLGLSDGEIVDVVLAAAARCFFSKVLDALGARPDARYAELEPGIREALTVGHAIASG